MARSDKQLGYTSTQWLAEHSPPNLGRRQKWSTHTQDKDSYGNQLLQDPRYNGETNIKNRWHKSQNTVHMSLSESPNPVSGRNPADHIKPQFLMKDVSRKEVLGHPLISPCARGHMRYNLVLSAVLNTLCMCGELSVIGTHWETLSYI